MIIARFARLLPLIAAIGLASTTAGCGKTERDEPVPSAADLDKVGKETLAVMERHAEMMKTRDVEKIVADYSDDTIVIATLFPEPIVGKDALRKAVADVLKIPPVAEAAEPTFTRKEAVGELGYQIFETEGLTGTETYVVRNGKIVFETANITLKAATKK
jgi:hypothetical protein